MLQGECPIQRRADGAEDGYLFVPLARGWPSPQSAEVKKTCRGLPALVDG